MRKTLREFLEAESSSGMILLVAAALSMIWVNSPLAFIHQQFIDTFLFTINDGLMAFFFLMVGLELKRGILYGPLSQPSQVILPAVAAIGGMLVPACIYCMLNIDKPTALQGWATPVATDIAFGLGVLTLFGKRVPMALKLFLLVLAIFDDIGAIVIIAVFYSKTLSYPFLILSGIITLLLYGYRSFGVRTLAPYLLTGVLLWLSLLHSGVHPTLTGVLVALSIPMEGAREASLGHRLERWLSPYAAFVIMPLFALANAGFTFSGVKQGILQDTVVLGIVCGLFFGKQIGVMGCSWLMIRCKVAKLPEHTSWLALYGIALLCGIGFTMSLFLGTLSFEEIGGAYLAEVRMGVIIGSILSGVTGAMVLFRALPSNQNRAEKRH